MRDYHAAYENFIQVLSMPGHAISAILIAAYKKLLIVSLFITGKKFVPPKYVIVTIGKIEKYVKKYEDLVACYEQGDAKVLETFLDENDNEALFSKDTNIGLVRRLQETMVIYIR